MQQDCRRVKLGHYLISRYACIRRLRAERELGPGLKGETWGTRDILESIERIDRFTAGDGYYRIQ
jgi:hypothetical protein